MTLVYIQMMAINNTNNDLVVVAFLSSFSLAVHYNGNYSVSIFVENVDNVSIIRMYT